MIVQNVIALYASNTNDGELNTSGGNNSFVKIIILDWHLSMQGCFLHVGLTVKLAYSQESNT